MSADIPFIGKGWSFPPEFTKGSTGIKIVTGQEDIEQSLYILLSTRIGERFMLPNFGCDLSILLFESMDEGLQKRLEDMIRGAILLYETRINVEKIVFDYRVDDGLVNIDIQYIIRTTNTRTNIVYPYYLNEGTNL
ncbi:MAG TPA: hypothetical protein DCQ31_04150 [Bacteroidales bacterium]|nr:hypothetical protein [Bacteroidales bacterium]